MKVNRHKSPKAAFIPRHIALHIGSVAYSLLKLLLIYLLHVCPSKIIILKITMQRFFYRSTFQSNNLFLSTLEWLLKLRESKPQPGHTRRPQSKHTRPIPSANRL